MKKSIFNPYLLSTKNNPTNNQQNSEGKGTEEKNSLIIEDLKFNDEQMIINKDLSSEEKGTKRENSEIILTHDPNEVIRNILNTDQRTDKDVWMLYEAFKDSKFFRQYINNTDERERLNALLYLCKRLKYETWGAQTLIIKQGEYSNGKVYIVLSGELTVLIKNVEKAGDHCSRNDISISANTDHEESRSQSISIACKKPIVNNSIFSVIAAIKEKKVSRNVNKREQLSFSEESRNSSRKNSIILKAPNNPSLDLTKNIFKKGIASSIKNILAKPGTFVELDNFGEYGSVVGQLQQGDHFGEKALFKTHKRSATVITKSEVELLVLDRETFKHVQYEFERMKHLITEFLKVTMPCMEKVQTLQVLEGLRYVSDVRDFPYHKTLAIEGQLAEEFFLVYEGQCELTKTIIYDNSECSKIPTSEVKSLYGLKKTKKEEIVISNVEKGSFIAEETCYNEKTVYHYTARVSSNRAKIICFKKNTFLFRCPKIIQESIQKIFANKKERFTKILLEKLQKKGLNPNYEDLSGVKPVVTLNKTMNLLPFNFSPASSNRKIIEKTKSMQLLNNLKNKTLVEVENQVPYYILAGNVIENEPYNPINVEQLTAEGVYSANQMPTPHKRKFQIPESLTIRDFFSSHPQPINEASKQLVSERISSHRVLRSRRSFVSIDEIDVPTTDEQKISITRFDFGPHYKERGRRNKTDGAKKKVDPNSGTQFNHPPSLADFLTLRLKESQTRSNSQLDDQPRLSIKIDNNHNFNLSLNDFNKRVSIPSFNLDMVKSPLISPLGSPRLKTALTSPRAKLGLSSSLSNLKFIGPLNSQTIVNLAEYAVGDDLHPNKKITKPQQEEKEVINIHVRQKSASSFKRPFSSLTTKRKQRKQ